MSKKVMAVSDVTPIIEPADIMPEDIASFCSMIITNVTDGKVTKTGLITSKEKLEKLMKLSDVTVKDGEFEAMKIRGHEVIAIVSTERVVTFRKVEDNNEETNPNNNKENGKMEDKNETKVETTNAASAAEAAPEADVKPEAGVTSAEQLFESKEANEIYQAIRKANSDSIEEMKANRDPLWKDCLKSAAIGGAIAVGGLTVCAIYSWITGK